MLGHKLSLTYLRRLLLPSIFSDYNNMNLELSNRKKSGKFTNAWKLNNTILNNQQSKKIEIGKYLEINESGITTYQNLWI